MNLGATRFDKAARASQIEQLRKARADEVDPLRTPGNEPLRGKTTARHVALALTGIHLIDTVATNLEHLSAALPDHAILEDEPLSLIDPTRSDVREDESELDLWHFDAIGLAAARDAGFHNKGTGVGVAVLDTGIAEVPEIRGRVKASYSMNSSGDWTRVHTQDTDGHGTHVAGLVAGSRTGVAPGVELTNVIMIPKGIGMVSSFVSALEFVARDPEISILNMSAGMIGYHTGMRSAVEAVKGTGVFPVIAIGNEGQDTNCSPGNYREVLSVGAATKDDRVAGFSGGGTMDVGDQSYPIPNLVAPGESVTSCVMGGGYESWSGTSMATPIVSGLAALIIERYPTITGTDLQDELLGAARELPGFAATRQGKGLVQLPAGIYRP